MDGCLEDQQAGIRFGTDPSNYDAIRPSYPEPIYQFLWKTGALPCSDPVLEIGAGTGLATRRLLEYGANPLTVVEPDSRFAPMLSSLSQRFGADLCLIAEPFEEAELPLCHYSLVAAATSFHWIRPTVGLEKIASVLKPGGRAALWWNVFGDPEREDPFHEATKAILQPLEGNPPDGPGTAPFALDAQARLRDFAGTGLFEPAEFQIHRWTLTLNTEQVGALYATFSHILRLSPAQRKIVLDQLMEIAEKQFRGTVERNMVSPIYVAKRKFIAEI